MDSHSTREQRKQDLRRVLLDAAKEIFLREGYDGFSMRKLAAQVGYSAGTIYLHFEGKGELLETLTEDSFSRLASSLAGLKERHEGRDPVEVLRKILYTYVEFGVRNPHEYRRALVGQQAKATCAGKIILETMQQVVRRCVEEARFREVDPVAASEALWATVHGVTSLLIQSEGIFAAGKPVVADLAINSVLGGLLSSPVMVQAGETRLAESAA